MILHAWHVPYLSDFEWCVLQVVPLLLTLAVLPELDLERILCACNHASKAGYQRGVHQETLSDPPLYNSMPSWVCYWVLVTW